MSVFRTLRLRAYEGVICCGLALVLSIPSASDVLAGGQSSSGGGGGSSHSGGALAHRHVPGLGLSMASPPSRVTARTAPIRVDAAARAGAPSHSASSSHDRDRASVRHRSRSASASAVTSTHAVASARHGQTYASATATGRVSAAARSRTGSVSASGSFVARATAAHGQVDYANASVTGDFGVTAVSYDGGALTSTGGMATLTRHGHTQVAEVMGSANSWAGVVDGVKATIAYAGIGIEGASLLMGTGTPPSYAMIVATASVYAVAANSTAAALAQAAVAASAGSGHIGVSAGAASSASAMAAVGAPVPEPTKYGCHDLRHDCRR